MSTKLYVVLISFAVIIWLENVFPYFKGRKNWLTHAFPNMSLAILNGGIVSLFSAQLTINMTSLVETNSWGIVGLLEAPVLIKGIIAVILFDGWMYAWHLASHRIRILWYFHRVHHTDLDMDSTTALRFHPIEIFISSLARLAVIPILGINMAYLFIYELALQPVILFHHSNIALPEKYDAFLRTIFVTPNMHRIHHSNEWYETNSNYSSIFSFWDRLNQTFRKRDDTSTIVYGLKIFRDLKWQRLWGMLITPFK